VSPPGRAGGPPVLSGHAPRAALSVAELQDALRAARARAAGRTGSSASEVIGLPPAVDVPLPSAAESGSAASGRGRVVVLGAHPGAGASTVALALAEAVAAGGRLAHLIECAPPARSGLLAAAGAELGADGVGRWRRGVRGQVVIDRLTGEGDPAAGWPVDPAGDRPGVTIVDLGVHAGPFLDGAAAGSPLHDGPLVVVARATVPGLRRAEHVLHRLGRAVPVAVVGPPRWPGPVRSSAGLRLAERRRAGQVVAVPLDRALEVTGVHSGPLSKRLAASGRALLAVLDAAPDGAAIPGSVAVRREGALR
jgi:hypothetical protein